MSRKSSSSENSDRGNIYVLINQSIPGQVKIGKTKKTPEQRAKQLSGTGVPTPYEVAYYREVMNMSAVEKEVHRRLQARRTNDKREFFAVSVPDAVATINTVYESFFFERVDKNLPRRKSISKSTQAVRSQSMVDGQSSKPSVTQRDLLSILLCAIVNSAFWSIFAAQLLPAFKLKPLLFNSFGLFAGFIVTVLFAAPAIFLRRNPLPFLIGSLLFSLAIQILT